MDRRFSNAASSLASMALKSCTELASYWRTVLADQGYRPELHYMRAMCGRLRVGKAFLHVCRLVGAAMCSAC
jgi:hypothetical protein